MSIFVHELGQGLAHRMIDDRLTLQPTKKLIVMLRKLVKKLDEYLNCKGGLNGQEEELRNLCDSCKGIFPISCLMRDDFEEKNFDTSSLSDEQMARLASKMGDTYVENDFHSSLVTFAVLYNIPQKNK